MKHYVAWIVGGVAVLAAGVFTLVTGDSGVPVKKPLTVDDLHNPEPDGLQNVSAPPVSVPLPDGWRRTKTSAEVPRAALSAANGFLYTSSMGQFQDNGTWGLIKEYHHDDHVGGVLRWHPGVTVLVPQSVQA